MNGYIITADILSLLFMGIVLCGALLNSKNNRKLSTKMFIFLMVMSLIAIIADASSYLAEEVYVNDTFLRVLNLLSYAFIVIMIDIFSLYMITVIKEKADLSFRVLIPVILISVINLVLLFVGTVNEKLFFINDHRYFAGEWDIGAYIFTLCYAMYLCSILYRYRNKIGIKSILGLGSYLLFPFLLSIGVIFFDLPDFTYASATLSLLIIYLTIQTKTISEALLREEILNEVSRNDSLTGLRNRRAYDEFLQNNSPGSNLGVAFFDLNSLKYTNDTYGHAAGDSLIKTFADILKDQFNDGNTFRISGDEFVVSVNPASGEDMDRRMNDLRELICSKGRIAAMGYVYRESGNLLAMVREAEKRMYNDKALYYKETGKDRRI